MNWTRLIIATVIIWIMSAALIMLTCGWLFSWVYEIPPIIWKDPTEFMSTNAMIFTYGVGIVIAFLFTLVYAILYKGIPGKGVGKGLMYGLLLWLVGALSGMVTMPIYMTIATTVIVYWIIQALVHNLIAGLIVGAIYKPK